MRLTFFSIHFTCTLACSTDRRTLHREEAWRLTHKHLLSTQLLIGQMTSFPPSTSPQKGKADFGLPMPPPLLHTRSGNDIYDNMPQTPASGFTSPYATPQGSPSKKQFPPGANELPNVFDNAMKLASSSPTKAGRQQLAPHSPNMKAGKQAYDQTYEDAFAPPQYARSPGSPLKKEGKENTPPGFRSPKPSTPNQAAVSRQEPYQTRDTDSGARVRYNTQRGLTAEELEKLQLPKVKRLANVTQLCTQYLGPWTSVANA